MIQLLFNPLFPEWKKNLVLPKPEFKKGVYLFKVSLGKIWRSIAIPSTNNFEDLSDAILEAFEFDGDHLYSFSFKNTSGVTIEINHPYIEKPPFVDEYSISEALLQEGMTLKFHYDFGASWKFLLKLEKFDVQSKIKKVTILESHGKSPEQYPEQYLKQYPE
ncbi:MAG: hypothetical protein AABZ60_04770 [Planctomycetota bacterium]